MKPKLRIFFLAAKSKYVWLGFVISIFCIILITTITTHGIVDYASRAHISGIPHKSYHNVNAEALFAKLLPPPSSASPSVKILCYILLSRSKVRTAMLIKETWGSHCDKLLFFGGYQYPELPVTFVNATEGYENLWGKAKAALLYLSGNSYFKDYQYFLKADDDTFVIMENLREFIVTSTPSLNKPVWFGFKLKHKRMPQGYMSGGAGYVFNNAALTRIGTILRKPSQQVNNDIGDCNVDGEYGVEDLELVLHWDLVNAFSTQGFKLLIQQTRMEVNDFYRYRMTYFSMELSPAFTGFGVKHGIVLERVKGAAARILSVCMKFLRIS